jgi:hypothetical protein
MTPAGIVQIVPGRNDRDQHVFSVLVKRTYRIEADRPAIRQEEDRPFRLIDDYYDGGDPEWSTVRHESEVAPFKLSTDVVVIARAYAPRGVPTTRMSVGVQVGERRKILVVTGDRQCHFRRNAAPVVSDPEPFTEMEIRYDRTYGGRDEKSVSEIPFVYPRNFMGVGVALKNVEEVVQGLALPNVEDPQDLLTPERVIIGEPDRWHLQPLPQGFGWRQREWYPRSALLGSFPPFLYPGTVTAEEQMGLLPRDHVALAKQFRLKPFEARFANGASLGMQFSGLKGDEPIALAGLRPDGLLKFSLPAETPRIGLDLGGGLHELEPLLHTISIRPDDLELDMIWRGAHRYDGYRWLSKMTKLHAEVH